MVYYIMLEVMKCCKYIPSNRIHTT